MKRGLFVGAPLLVALTLGLSTRQGYGQDQDRNDDHRVPHIVAQVALTAQTGTPGSVGPSTTFFTPKADGLFRIALYFETLPDRQTAPTISLFWVDDVGPKGYSTVSSFEDSIVVRAKGKQPISYNVFLDPTFTGSYSLFITVERL